MFCNKNLYRAASRGLLKAVPICEQFGPESSLHLSLAITLSQVDGQSHGCPSHYSQKGPEVVFQAGDPVKEDWHRPFLSPIVLELN